MTNQDQQTLSKLSHLVGKDGFLHSFYIHMDSALKKQDMRLQKKLRDVEWSHQLALRGEYDV